jgi:hypothetical protein
MKCTCALLNSGAESNFVSQKWVKMYLPDSVHTSKKVQALDGHKITAYLHHNLSVRVTDTQGLAHQHVHGFKAVNMVGYKVILSFLWLEIVNPNVDWLTHT